jgi:hypothetical protein
MKTADVRVPDARPLLSVQFEVVEASRIPGVVPSQSPGANSRGLTGVGVDTAEHSSAFEGVANHPMESTMARSIECRINFVRNALVIDYLRIPVVAKYGYTEKRLTLSISITTSLVNKHAFYI